MAKQLMVVSTLTAPQRYQQHGRGVNRGVPAPVVREVLIKGGTGLVDRFERTLVGVETPISAEDAEFLRGNRQFQKHMERGFVKIVETGVEAEAVASEMETRDGSAPMTETVLEQKAKNVKPKSKAD